MTDPIKWFISILAGSAKVAQWGERKKAEKKKGKIEKKAWRRKGRMRKEEKKEEAKSVVLVNSGYGGLQKLG